MTNEITVAELNKLIKNIVDSSTFDGEVLYLGNLLEIKPVYMYNKNGNKSLEGYDIYKYADKKLMEDENYNFDADYICTIHEN